jgi:hypothetical protein
MIYTTFTTCSYTYFKDMNKHLCNERSDASRRQDSGMIHEGKICFQVRIHFKVTWFLYKECTRLRGTFGWVIFTRALDRDLPLKKWHALCFFPILWFGVMLYQESGFYLRFFSKLYLLWRLSQLPCTQGVWEEWRSIQNLVLVQPPTRNFTHK